MYDALFEAWRREKANDPLQKLPKDFYSDLAGYLKKISEEKRMLDEKTVKGNLILKEEENVKNLLRDLLGTRREKIMQSVDKGVIAPVSMLSEEEEELYRGSAIQSDAFQAFIKKMLQGKIFRKKQKARNMAKPRKKQKRLLIVRILQEIPETLGTDLKTYGPIKPEDIVSLPKELARMLIRQGIATEIETQ